MGGASKPRVAIVYDPVYPWVKGGAEKRIFDLAPLIARRGIDVHVYGMKYWAGASEFERDGVTYHGICAPMPLYTTSGRRSIRQAIYFGLACVFLFRESFDAIDCQVFPFFSTIACAAIAKIKGSPLVVTWHEVWGAAYWSNYLGRLGIFGALVERFASRLGSLRISVSELTSRRLVDDLHVSATTIATVPSAVDVTAIRAVPPAGNAVDVIYVGRLVDFKNVDVLIAAIGKLRDQGRRKTLAIVGDGPARASLETQTRDLGLVDLVEFRGRVPGDIYGHIKSAKALVLPSSREGFGLVVIESYACGVPVITVDEADNAAKLLVSPTTGALCKLDPEALASAISATVDSSAELYDKCLLKAADYDLARCAERTAEVYLQSIASRAL